MPEAPDQPSTQLDTLLRMASAVEAPPPPCAVVHPCDAASLRGALDAARHRLIDPVLVGPVAKILAAAATIGVAPADLPPIEDVLHSHAAAARAVALCRAGRAAALMKGSLHTDELLAEVVARATGLRTERRLSHVLAMAVPSYPKPLFLTDAAVNIAPDLAAKADIARNAIDLCRALGLWWRSWPGLAWR